MELKNGTQVSGTITAAMSQHLSGRELDINAVSLCHCAGAKPGPGVLMETARHHHSNVHPSSVSYLELARMLEDDLQRRFSQVPDCQAQREREKLQPIAWLTILQTTDKTVVGGRPGLEQHVLQKSQGPLCTVVMAVSGRASEAWLFTGPEHLHLPAAVRAGGHGTLHGMAV
eukprot:Skav217026  [mRNA]  locus=scaffold1803:327535:333674:- [translate_table: standard]